MLLTVEKLKQKLITFIWNATLSGFIAMFECDRNNVFIFIIANCCLHLSLCHLRSLRTEIFDLWSMQCWPRHLYLQIFIFGNVPTNQIIHEREDSHQVKHVTNQHSKCPNLKHDWIFHPSISDAFTLIKVLFPRMNDVTEFWIEKEHCSCDIDVQRCKLYQLNELLEKKLFSKLFGACSPTCPLEDSSDNWKLRHSVCLFPSETDSHVGKSQRR